MLKQSFCATAVVLALSSPAWASHKDAPTLSGTYAYTFNAICYQTGSASPNFTQEVGEEKFNPLTGISKPRSGANIVSAGTPVLFQGTRGTRQTFKIVSAHKMIYGGIETYVQFGTVVNGVATSAYLIASNSSKSCSFQKIYTQIAP